jgi:hypothetical protein
MEQSGGRARRRPRTAVAGHPAGDGEDHMAMQGEIRAGGWARRGRRLLLGLGVLAAGGVAVLLLAVFALAHGLGLVHGGPVPHGGLVQAALLVVLALMAAAAVAAVALAWIARRLWRRGAWLEALPLLAGMPWLSRVVWAARVLWTGHALWRLRGRLAARGRGQTGIEDQDRAAARSGTTR